MFYIYRNLRLENTFSLRLKGKVVERLTDFVACDVRFKVNESGRQTVIADQQKNVHAFVVSENFFPLEPSTAELEESLALATYNPYKAGHFVCDGEPIHRATQVLFTGGKCHILEF